MLLGSTERATAFWYGSGLQSVHFSAPHAAVGKFLRHSTRLYRELNSPGRRRRPLQSNEAAQIIDQVHHADLHSRTLDPDGARPALTSAATGLSVGRREKAIFELSEKYPC
jgi:hypothetical protein